MQNKTEFEIDNMLRTNLIFDDKFLLVDNLSVSRYDYDTCHGKSIYNDNVHYGPMPFDSDEDESVKELRKKLVNKLKILY